VQTCDLNHYPDRIRATRCRKVCVRCGWAPSTRTPDGDQKRFSVYVVSCDERVHVPEGQEDHSCAAGDHKRERASFSDLVSDDGDVGRNSQSERKGSRDDKPRTDFEKSGSSSPWKARRCKAAGVIRSTTDRATAARAAACNHFIGSGRLSKALVSVVTNWKPRRAWTPGRDDNACFCQKLLDCHSACNIDPLSRGIGVQN
jgi:hypothetical protein